MRVTGLKAGQYLVRTQPQRLYLARFGSLVNHISPVTLNPEGILLQQANRYYSLADCVEEYNCSAATLSVGIPLNNQFTGVAYNENVRLLGDFGSNLYIVEKVNTEEADDE